MNKYRFTVSQTDTELNIPINIDFDDIGREDLVVEYENEVLEKVINPIEDFETTRFSNKIWLNQNGLEQTSLSQEFYFFDRSVNVTSTTNSSTNLWVSNYNFVDPAVYLNFSGITFTDREIYYFVNSFKRSFFKLDFYDSPKSEDQKIYLTIIIPTQQGRTISADIGTATVPKIVDIRTPSYDLDFVGDKKGYFIYWLKEKTYINLDELYVSAKFFNAKTGQFVRMMNRPQCTLSDKFSVPKEEYFYYKVNLDYNNYEYEIFNVYGNQNRVGQTNNPLTWYEYINP